MQNWFFEPRQLDVLLSPERWKVVTSAVPGPACAGAARRYQRWYAAHAQRHAHREILVCLTGRGYYGLGNAVYPTAPGVVMLFDSMEAHQLGYPRFAPPQDHLWMALLPDQFTARVLKVRHGRLTSQAVTAVLYESDDAGLRVTDRTLGLAGDSVADPGIRHLRLLAAVGVMLSTLVERGFRTAPVAPARLDDTQRLMVSLMEHLRESGGRGDSVGSLARIAGYSPFHFLRLFKRMTGYTVHQYIDQCRCRKVRQLLAANWRKSAIAAELGFSTPQSFSRWYRERMPSAR